MKNCLYIFGGAIGDALLGVHLGRELAAARPGARLTVISTRKNAFVRQLLAPLPFVSFVEMPKESIFSWLQLAQLALAPHKAAFFEPISGRAPLWWRLVLRAATLWPGSRAVRAAVRPQTDRMFDLTVKVLHQWGVEAPALVPHLEAALYGATAQRQKPYMVFHFTAAGMRRSMPLPHARALLAAVKAAYPTHSLVLTCAGSEIERTNRIAEGFDVEIAKNLPAAELVQLLSGASAYVGVDTGTTHIACHLGIPCVVLGNRSNPCWLPYYAPNAAVLFEPRRCTCNGDKTGDCAEHTAEGDFYRCLYDIPTETIIKKLQDFLPPAC